MATSNSAANIPPTPQQRENMRFLVQRLNLLLENEDLFLEMNQSDPSAVEVFSTYGSVYGLSALQKGVKDLLNEGLPLSHALAINYGAIMAMGYYLGRYSERNKVSWNVDSVTPGGK